MRKVNIFIRKKQNVNKNFAKEEISVLDRNLYRVSQKNVPVLNLNNSKNTPEKDKNKVFFES